MDETNSVAACGTGDAAVATSGAERSDVSQDPLRKRILLLDGVRLFVDQRDDHLTIMGRQP